MSYNNTAKKEGGFRGAPAQGSAPASAPVAGQKAGTGTKPTHSLKVKGEDGKFIKLCSVFTNVSEKTGETYYKGKDSQSGVTYFIMPITEYKER